MGFGLRVLGECLVFLFILRNMVVSGGRDGNGIIEWGEALMSTSS